MGIKNLPRRLNEAGKIKIGMKGSEIKSATGTVFRKPVRLDHFIVTGTDKTADGDFVIDTALIEKIKAGGRGVVNERGDLVGIPVRLLYEDNDLNFPTRYASYILGKLSCTGDGEKCTKRLDDFTKEYPCPCERLDPAYKGKDKCKPNGKLTCVIDEANLFGQVHVFRTTSINSVMGITGGLDLLRTATKGHIAGIPLMLVVNNKSTTIPGEGTPTTVQVVSLCYRGDMMSLRNETLKLLEQDRRYLLGMDDLQAEARANGVGEVVPESEEADFIAEFMPDAIVIDHVPPGEDIGSIPPGTPGGDNATLPENPCPDDDNSTEYQDRNLPIKDQGLYDRLAAETDLDAAVALMRRLQKSDLVNFIRQYFPNALCTGTAKKPEYIKLLTKFIRQKLTSDHGNETAAHNVEEHPFITELKTIAEAGKQIDVVAAMRARFTRPVNGTLPIPELIAAAKKWIAEGEVLSNKEGAVETATVKEDNGENHGQSNPGENSGGTESAETPETVQGNMACGENEKAKTINPAQTESVDWRKADDGPAITRDQKFEIVNLKNALEKAGKITGDQWVHTVALFFDKAGLPLKSAVGMTEKQAQVFITRLGEALNDDVPF